MERNTPDSLINIFPIIENCVIHHLHNSLVPIISINNTGKYLTYDFNIIFTYTHAHTHIHYTEFENNIDYH